MTDWKTDLDEFVKETMAFAKSLRVEPPMPRTIVEPDRIPPVKGIESEREEIRQRVANFKAHQQRFIREREDYAESEWKRTLASQREAKKLDCRKGFLLAPPGPRRRLIRTVPGGPYSLEANAHIKAATC